MAFIRHLNSSKLADFKVSTEACMLTFGIVEHVDAQLGGHVKAVVRTDVDAHLARRTRFPNDADTTVVVAGNKEPRLHVLKTLVWVLHRLWFPERGLEVRGYSVGGELLSGDVVHLCR